MKPARLAVLGIAILSGGAAALMMRGSEPPPPPPPPRGPALDPRALFVLLDGLRRVVPRELEGQLTSLIREFLLTLRALIDWYLERLDRGDREPEVEEIPID